MKKKSYIICSVVSILLWALATVYFIQSKSGMQPPAMVNMIQEGVFRQQDAVRKVLDNKELMNHLWQNRLSEDEFRILSGQNFIVHLYENGKLTFWNKNDFPVAEYRFFPDLLGLKEGHNFFLYQSFGKADYPSKRINIVFPVYKHYDVSNEYLKSGFLVSSVIPETSVISLDKKSGTSLIRSKEGFPLFYVTIDKDNIKPLTPDWCLLALIISALFTSVLSIQFIGVYLSRSFSPLSGGVFVFCIVFFLRMFVYWFGLPYDLENLDLFSPQIFASNNFLPSLGHLFLHVICIYWFLSFLVLKSTKFEQFHFRSTSKSVCYSVFGVAILLVFILGLYLQHLLQSIVFDSDISFDTNTFKATDKFTLFALVIIALISRTFLLSLSIVNVILNRAVQNTRKKYAAAVLISFALLLLYRYWVPAGKGGVSSAPVQHWLDAFAIVWAVVYLYFLDSKYFKGLFSNSGLFSLIFLSVYFSILFSVYFKFYIDKKEQNVTRIAFAEKLSRQQDTELELKFDEIESRIKKDTVLQHWLQNDDSVSVSDIYRHFKLYNADLYFTKYAEDIFLYNRQGKPIVCNKSLPLDSLIALRSRSIPTLNQSLFFRLDRSEQGAYLVIVPILDVRGQTLGYLGINLKLKQNISQSVYPRLLKKQQEHDSKSGLKYNYAIYINGRLANQSGSYNFDYTIPGMPEGKVTQYFQKNAKVSELYYKAAANMVYVVVYENNIVVGVITIFSFLFGIFLLIATVENWLFIFFSAWMSGKRIKMIYNASMSVRVKYFALGFTAISFFIIGLSTVLFLTSRYQASSIRDIEQRTANISEAIAEYLQNQQSGLSNQRPEDQISGNEFAFFLTTIAQQQKMDINIFDVQGRLTFTTQDNIYEARVLDRNMPAHAFYTLNQKRLSGYIQPERVGLLKYTASYSPIVNADNKLIAYLNIPSFYTKQHLDNQIVSLITTLVNIYTILLLISSIVTFLFINTLTKSLRLVADSLKNVSLKNNELINWPYKDEIGLLVDEYNKMVATVEKNARSLVLDERQNAWREMAQQVAHEIKNPLTPMKLNIQYLQQAINSNHPDIINLTKRVSSSIIEQIDNLNYIASEFSNFAKMPENKTERIDLKSMLERIVLLFAGNKNLTIKHSLPEVPVVVFADKSQMLRIFTNIVQNAVESIPTDERPGIVDVELLLNPEANVVVIKVKDNGSGIPEEVKDKIFDPYFTTKSSGTGLGLAMTKKIIELWGGTISFESTKDDGTIFLLTVPLG